VPLPPQASRVAGELFGLAEVSELAMDDQGIWRGKAMRDGKQVTVGLDYKGNIAVQ
jgi:putative membrane protein